jgi:hypothetical protein
MAMIAYLTKVQFDFGALGLLANELALAGVKHPLVVTDQGVVRAGILEKVKACLPANMPVAVFDETPENPTEAAAERGAEAYRANGCDGIIGLGGGSAMDEAKAVAILAHNPGPLEAYSFPKAGYTPPIRTLGSLIMIPTTAGTGSEVGRASVLIFKNGRKTLIACPPNSVTAAILDPELTFDLPPGLTAATGMDAISHCVETFCSPRVNPPADAIALDGLARAAPHLERAVADGHDREARWQMLMAAMEGAMAFQKGLGAVHALAHPLGELHLHHGTLNAILMPHVLAFNASHLGPKMQRLREALRLSPGVELPDFFTSLNRGLGLPSGLAELGVTASQIPLVARQAMEDSAHGTNPRPMQVEDYEKILTAAL